MKRNVWLPVFLLLFAAIALAACGGSSNTNTAQPGTGGSGNLGSSGNTGDTDDGPSVTDPTGGDTGGGSSDTTGGATGDMTIANDDPLITGAIADLASRLGVTDSDITVVRAARVTWPDSSFGCPQPDMSYTQALAEGNFIQLQANGEMYNYHGGDTVAPALCESSNEVLPEDLGATQ